MGTGGRSRELSRELKRGLLVVPVEDVAKSGGGNSRTVSREVCTGTVGSGRSSEGWAVG